MERLDELGLALSAQPHGPHLFGVRPPASRLAGIEAALAAASCFAPVRARSPRIAPHLPVSESDVERLIGALRTASGRSQWRA